MAQAAIRGITYAVGASANIVVGLPGGAQDGDYLLCVVADDQSAYLTPPAGWTQEANYASGAATLTLYSHIYTAATDTLSWTWGSVHSGRAVMVAIHNYNFIAPIDQRSGSTAFNVTTIQPGSRTPTYTDDLALDFAVAAWFTGQGPFTLAGPGAPWTEDMNQAGPISVLLLDHQALSSTAAVNPTFTGSAGTYYLAALQVLIHSGAGAPPPVAFVATAEQSQVAAEAVYAAGAGVLQSADVALVAYGLPASRDADVAQVAAVVVYAADAASAMIPEQSQTAALVVWTTAPPGAEPRTRAWTFTFDGHPFYVLDLGEEGTFLYDINTQQWCRFITTGYTGWNMRVGVMWGESNRVVGGDTFAPQAWELGPDLTLDEGFRDIFHAATGGIMTRTRTYLSVEALRVSGSLGALDSAGIVLFSMRFSDDNGQTWSDYYTVPMTAGDFTGEVMWRSLGSFMAPGRVFELTDFGGLQRIDGADLFIEDFDDANDKLMRQYGIYQ